MINTLSIQVDELWLKGKNRPVYFKALKNHIKAVVKAWITSVYEIIREDQRFVLKSPGGIPDELLDALTKIPGINSIIPVRSIPADFDAIIHAVSEELAPHIAEKPDLSFKIETRRLDKKFPKRSMEISREVGGMALDHFPGLRVDLHHPDVRVQIKVHETHIYVSSRTIPGACGLPWGTSGKVVTLISGGFDSPVASSLMVNRGCEQIYVFFYAYPFVGHEVEEKIVRLCQVLSLSQIRSRLFVVPFGAVQEEIAKLCRESYRTLLFRKAMVESACLLADRVGAEALLTGDSLGQVSSQTLNNIGYIDSVTRYPVLRPLIGYNKQEIIRRSRQIGTHDISVIPHDDACSLFAPRHPVIRPDLAYLKDFDNSESFTALLNRSLDQARVYYYQCNGEYEIVQNGIF